MGVPHGNVPIIVGTQVIARHRGPLCLGPKVLYKYKDMTVEFRDGKVADVR